MFIHFQCVFGYNEYLLFKKLKLIVYKCDFLKNNLSKILFFNQQEMYFRNCVFY